MITKWSLPVRVLEAQLEVHRRAERHMGRQLNDLPRLNEALLRSWLDTVERIERMTRQRSWHATPGSRPGQSSLLLRWTLSTKVLDKYLSPMLAEERRLGGLLAEQEVPNPAQMHRWEDLTCLIEKLVRLKPYTSIWPSGLPAAPESRTGSESRATASA